MFVPNPLVRFIGCLVIYVISAVAVSAILSACSPTVTTRTVLDGRIAKYTAYYPEGCIFDGQSACSRVTSTHYLLTVRSCKTVSEEPECSTYEQEVNPATYTKAMEKLHDTNNARSSP